MKKLWIGQNTEAIAILRVSTRKQEKNLSHSIQEDEVREYAQREGLDLVKVIKIAESAKDSETRVKYHEAMLWRKSNKARHVLFYMGDREARNLTDNENNERMVLRDEMVLHYVRENKVLHCKSPESDFTARDYQAVGNKDFSRRLSAKVNDAMRKKAENGWFPGNKPTPGYVHQKLKDENGNDLKRGTIIVKDPSERIVKRVQREFELRSQNNSIEDIRNIILDEGLVLPSERAKYSKRGIDGRLKNKFYRGYFDWQGVEYKGLHPIIIPQNILDAVGDSFGKHRVTRRPKGEHDAFSGGWLRCGCKECGLQIISERKTKKIKATGEMKTYHYYRCSNSRGTHKSLKGMNISEAKIIELFEPALDRVTVSDTFAEQIAKALTEAGNASRLAVKKEMEQFELALDRLDSKRDQLFDMYSSNMIDEVEYRHQSDRLKDDRRHYTKLLEESQNKIGDAWKVTAETVLELATNAKSLWKSANTLDKVNILKKLCWNPVLEGATIRYDLRKPFTTIVEMKENTGWRSLRESNPCLRRERAMS